MAKLIPLDFGYNVSGVQAALDKHPELWNQNTSRTAHPNSPHHGLDDIWVRFASDGVDGSQPHESVWRIPEEILPVRKIVYDMMSKVRGDVLGGVLITRIPPGASCKPHTDPGWHARFYEKFAVQIAGNDKQAFHFEDTRYSCHPGHVYWFDNSHLHWVTNDSDEARITMIVCIRTREFDAAKDAA